MKRVLSFTIALSFFLLYMPLKVSAMADDESDASFYLNYWVEENTGIDMKDIPVTAYGLSYADYIYRQTGYTVDYFVDTVTNPSNFGSNTSEYIQNTLYNDAEYMKDLLSTTPITNTTSQTYSNSYNDRVNSDGDINVSGSDYWNSVYNGLSNGGYKDQYQTSNNGSYNTSVNGENINISVAGIGLASNDQLVNSPFQGLSVSWDAYSNAYAILSVGGGYYQLSGNQYGVHDFDISSIEYDSSNNRYIINWFYHRINEELYSVTSYLYLNNGYTGSNASSGGTPVLQPKQCGYIVYNGNKIPVYNDPNRNPFTINPDGTVSYPNDDTKYPIFIDPNELSPDGDLILLQYIINNYYGDDNNITDPFSNDPYNRLNYPDNQSPKDYSDGFNSIISWLKKIYNKETDIIKYLKQIVKGLPLPNEDGEEEEEKDKFENFADMLKLFNGSNNDGFKQQILDKLGYSAVTTNINNFSTALFGSRTFNNDGSVNTQFGGISVTETPQLLYSYNGNTYNFWDNLTLINSNGDLSRAKEYVRFFIIFAFFLSFFRGLPSLINNVGGIISNSSMAVPVDTSESSVELTEYLQYQSDAPYPSEF